MTVGDLTYYLLGLLSIILIIFSDVNLSYSEKKVKKYKLFAENEISIFITILFLIIFVFFLIMSGIRLTVNWNEIII